MTDFPMVELPVDGSYYIITTDLLDEPIKAVFEGGRFVASLERYTLYVPQDMASVVERST